MQTHISFSIIYWEKSVTNSALKNVLRYVDIEIFKFLKFLAHLVERKWCHIFDNLKYLYFELYRPLRKKTTKHVVTFLRSNRNTILLITSKLRKFSYHLLYTQEKIN